jgi:hypothetical protein
MVKGFTDKKIKNLIADICEEHYSICSKFDTYVGNNLGYLWYMYHAGTKKGDFKPFIFLAEVNLLISLNYLNEESKDNILGMLKSEDEDNNYIAAISILELRKQRIKDCGLYTKDSKFYDHINYEQDVIKPDDFIKSKLS